MRSEPFTVGNSFNEWYETEKNTAGLIKAVLGSRDTKTFSGDDLWNVVRLTWITVRGQVVAKDHWQALKAPALALLFDREPVVLDDLSSTIKRMGLPAKVAKAAAQTTGVVNFRNVWRNSCRDWSRANREILTGILRDASQLPFNDDARYRLAARIGALPPISSPNGRTHVGAAAAITPVVACLDPSTRFPIINGREGVRNLLRKLKLQNGDLERQVKGLINLIGQFGIGDALTIDVWAEEIAASVTGLFPKKSFRDSFLKRTLICQRQTILCGAMFFLLLTQKRLSAKKYFRLLISFYLIRQMSNRMI